MNKKIIKANRYKKISKTKARTKSKIDKNRIEKKYSSKVYERKKLKHTKYEIKNNNKLNLENLVLDNDINSKIELLNNDANKNSSKKESKFAYKFLKVSVLIFCILIIGTISKLIMNKQEEKDTKVYSSIAKDVNYSYDKDYNFKIAINGLDNIDIKKSKNAIYNELVTYTYHQLISINKDYSINYIVADKISKISDREYIIELNKEYNITTQEVIASIESIKKEKDNLYYSKLKYIAELKAIDNFSLKITLKKVEPYFIYYLTFPIYEESSENRNKAQYLLTDKSGEILTFRRNTDTNSNLNTITFRNYSSSNKIVEEFRNNNVDMFFATTDNIMTQIGKHEYNVKKYRDGENLFLFGNKDSKLFKIKEVRKALTNSIDRSTIVKSLNPSFSEVIDVPFIYSNVNYQYDVGAAQSSLKQVGFYKSEGVYTKQIDGVITPVSLTLIVKESDSTKKLVAQKLKEQIEKVGIKLNVELLDDEEFNLKLKNKQYDLVLADVYINQVPDIRYLNDYVNINDVVKKQLETVEKCSIEDLATNILKLQNTISSEYACIGIYAKTTNVVYQKYIMEVNVVNYMKVFDDLNNIRRRK